MLILLFAPMCVTHLWKQSWETCEKVAPTEFPVALRRMLPFGFTGLGRCQEGVQRRLAGVAAALKCRPAQGVILPSPPIMLVAGSDLHPSCQVHHLWPSAFLTPALLCTFLKKKNSSCLYLQRSQSLSCWKHLHSLIYKDRVKNLHLFLCMLQFPDV